MPSLLASNADMHPIGPQELRDLILPVLACLPTAFLGTQPPPALLPLLSPILRQRVHLLSGGSSGATSEGSWLKFLTWSSERAEALTEIVSRLQLEPHPVSGELELFGDSSDPEVGKVWYRQLDEETIQARCDVREYNLGFVYVWATNDTGGIGIEQVPTEEVKDGWKVAEVVPLEGDENLSLEGWVDDLSEVTRSTARRIQSTPQQQTQTNGNHLTVAAAVGEEDDDADYWASYDRTPGKGTPATTRNASIGNIFGTAGQSEQEYFARYGDVQPAMDGHDPDEEPAHSQADQARPNVTNDAGQSHDRNGYTTSDTEYANFANLNDAIEQLHANGVVPSAAHAVSTFNPEQPLSSQEPATGPVAALERSASEMSIPAETAVKHHISTEMKSLFRLAQNVGIERDEFIGFVTRELEVLGQIEL